MTSVNAGGRLDRLPISSFHRRVFTLVGIGIPELFPTEVRLRATGICNTFGRGATILTPFLVVRLFTDYGITGVIALMVGLLALLIVVVMTMGIEPRQRSLEDLAEPELSVQPVLQRR